MKITLSYRRWHRCLLAAAMLVSSLSLAAPAIAPAGVLQELPQARLAGQGTMTWFGLTIYDAQLWVAPGPFQPTIADAKFVLDLRYARDLNGARIADASLKEIKQLGLGSPAQHEAWLAAMKRIFPNVTEGKHIAGVYLPGQGARFYLDGKLIGEVNDPQFAQAFFAIWLDPNTSEKGLRSALLAGAK